MNDSLNPTKERFSLAINKYIKPTNIELDKILEHFHSKEIRKSRYLVRSGQTSNVLIFIDKGCLRVFGEQNLKEVSGWFAFEDDFFCELSSFIPHKVSTFSVQAIEDTTLLYITRQEMEKLFHEVPIFETFVRRFWEEIIIHLINNMISFQTETAEKRYERALKHPKLINRVPLKYLSSYLGITPSSLSRLRKPK